MSEHHRHRPMSSRVFLALLVIVLTLLVQAAFENMQQRRTRHTLERQIAQQRPAIQQAQELQTQLEGIAGATAELADRGNANAILIRDQLQSQGVSIRPRRTDSQ